MVMGDITRIDTVQQYCDLFEVEALHPLVSVVNCYEVQPIRHSKKLYNIYAVLLKDTDCVQFIGWFKLKCGFIG